MAWSNRERPQCSEALVRQQMDLIFLAKTLDRPRSVIGSLWNEVTMGCPRTVEAKSPASPTWDSLIPGLLPGRRGGRNQTGQEPLDAKPLGVDSLGSLREVKLPRVGVG